MKRSAFLLVAAAAAIGLAACGNILGLKDLEPEVADGSGDVMQQEASGDGTNESSPPGDGPAMETSSSSGGDAREEDGALPDVTGTDTSMMDSSGMDSTSTMDSTSGMDSTTGMDTSTPDTSTTMDSGQGCETGTTSCGGTCFDLSNTANHCGSCARDCLGGTCVGSECTPYVFASSTVAHDMLVVGSSLYWVDEMTTVWTCSTAGASCNPTTLAGGQLVPTRLAYDGTSCLFWTNNNGGSNGSIGSHQLGSTACPATITGLGAPQGIAADSTYIFWTDTAGNKIVRYPHGGGSQVPYTIPVTNSFPAGIALEGGFVFWAEDGAGNVEMSQEGSWVDTNVTNGLSSPWALSVVGSTVYWVDDANPGSVWQYTSGSGASQVIGSQDYPIRVVGDTGVIYWTNWGSTTNNGELRTCDPASCTSPTLVKGSLQKPEGLAITPSDVYFGVPGASEIYRLVR